jgi:hypothetical protein
MLTVLGAAGCVCVAAAQSPDESTDHGFRRGAFLARGMAARPVSMGEVFTAVADDASAVSWNPGGLGGIPAFQAIASYDLGGYGLGVTYAAAAAPLGGGVGCVSLAVCNYGEYDLRDAKGLKTGTDNAMDLAAALAYAVHNPGSLPGSTGVTIETVHEAVGGSLVGVSAGSVIPVSGLVSVGWSVLHLGPKADRYALPAVARGGVAYRPMAGLTVATDAGYGLGDRTAWMAVGGEYAPAPAMALRVGYKWVAQDQTLSGLTGLNAGAGFSIGRIGLDYAFQPYGDMGISHRLSVRYGAGSRAGEIRKRAAPLASVPKKESASPAPEPTSPVAVVPALATPAGPVPVPEVEPSVIPVGDVGKALREGRDAYDAGRYDAAAKRLRQVLAVDSANAVALGYLGAACYRLRNLDESIRAYEAYLRLVPEDAPTRDFLDRLRRERAQP